MRWLWFIYESLNQSVELLLLVTVFIALASLDLAEGLDWKQVVKVRLLGHLVKANYLVDVAYSEAFVLLQDREKCKWDRHCPNYQHYRTKQLDEQLFGGARVNEATVSIKEADGKSSPEALDAKDDKGFLRVVDLEPQE